MGFLKLTKDLFAVKEPITQVAEQVQPQQQELNYQDHGFHQALMLGGSIPGLRICLQKIYFEFKEKIKNDLAKQEELKRPIRIKVEEHKGNIERWENRIKDVHERQIPQLQSKIDSLKEEKSHIRKNPQEIIGNEGIRSSFYIGGIILLFLTIYLFVFYSSASYSAFFKEFTLNQIGLANSIFDPKALTIAAKDGITELILIVTIPFVFLGLGYLIHKMQSEKGFKRFIKIAILIAVTFTFDGILAYDISEKIYNIRKENSFTDLPDYSIAFALKSINFWLIIFAGFIVYLIWGFVFDFVLDAFSKIDKVKVALREKELQIQDANKQLSDLSEDVNKMAHKIDDSKTEIKKLNEDLNSIIIPREFEQIGFGFMTGWLAWMKGNGKTHAETEAAAEIVHEFVKVAIYNYPQIQN